MTAVRWIVFFPVALIAALVASFIFRFVAGIWFPEVIAFILCGAVGAIAMITVGLHLAPKRSPVVKCILIATTALLGAFAALGSLFSADRIQAAIGISTLFVAPAFSGVTARDIADV